MHGTKYGGGMSGSQWRRWSIVGAEMISSPSFCSAKTRSAASRSCTASGWDERLNSVTGFTPAASADRTRKLRGRQWEVSKRSGEG